uniref:Protein NIM1-INTERACTING 1 n=1 Tax=Lactuca sativa TaxID=4236 RepID=A0A9R1WPH4_LACSA|nr:hypothetical protein LSAT_V11C900455200 [Lactuca sativa]
MENRHNIISSGQQHHLEEDDDDDRKMEIFFTLIRSFREARDRRRQELLSDMEKTNKTRKLHHLQSPSSPVFEWQDFTVGCHTSPVPVHQKPKQPRKEEEEEEANLNLKLSL